MSVTEIDYVAGEKRMEISCKLFVEDIELALKRIGGKYLDVGSPSDSAATHKLLAHYLFDHFKMKLDDQNIPITFLGFEKVDDRLMVYMEAIDVNSFSKACFYLSILYEDVAGQENFLHLNLSEGRKSGKVGNPVSLLCLE